MASAALSPDQDAAAPAPAPAIVLPEPDRRSLHMNQRWRQSSDDLTRMEHELIDAVKRLIPRAIKIVWGYRGKKLHNTVKTVWGIIFDAMGTSYQRNRIDFFMGRISCKSDWNLFLTLNFPYFEQRFRELSAFPEGDWFYQSFINSLRFMPTSHGHEPAPPVYDDAQDGPPFSPTTPDSLSEATDVVYLD